MNSPVMAALDSKNCGLVLSIVWIFQRLLGFPIKWLKAVDNFHIKSNILWLKIEYSDIKTDILAKKKLDDVF